MKIKNFESNHVLEILSKLNRERKSPKDYCDVTLIAGSQEFASHKCILGMFSTFYHKMFTVEMREKYENRACIQSVDEETMELVLNFIYTCHVTITSDNVYDLLKAANYMEIPHLKRFCVEFLHDEVDASNCLRLLAYAKLYNIDEITERANIVIEENFEALSQQKEFKELGFRNFSVIMERREKQVSSEEIVFHALIGWIKHDVTTRGKHLTQLFNELDLGNLSLDFMHNVVGKEELISNSHECTRILLQSTLSRCRVQHQEFSMKFFGFLSKSVWQYDVMKKAVAQMPNCQYDRCNGSAAVHNKKVYLIGGRLNSFVEMMDLNVEPLSWKRLNGTKIPRESSASVTCNDFIFTVGGYDGDPMKSGERYNVLTKRRDMIPDMNERRIHPALSAVGDSVYVLGGCGITGTMNTMECLQMGQGHWEKLPPMKMKRFQFPAVVLQDKLYAIGGYDCGYLDSVECYDLLKRRWHDVAKLNEPRSAHGACVINNKIYVAGGRADTLEVYDPAVNVWKIAAKVPKLRDVEFIVAI